ncbi:MAG: hypothetical protein U0228_32680 [Myxococcaceae bacterium]
MPPRTTKAQQDVPTYDLTGRSVRLVTASDPALSWARAAAMNEPSPLLSAIRAYLDRLPGER